MENNVELKAGHAPAQKVGGMRVVQHKRLSESEKNEDPTPKQTEEDKEEFGEDKPSKAPGVRILTTVTRMFVLF